MPTGLQSGDEHRTPHRHNVEYHCGFQRTRWCPRSGRDGHAAAHIDQGALRQQVQRGIERMQAVVTAPRAAQTHNLHRAGGRFGVAILLAPRRALHTTGVLGRTGNLSRAALVVMSLQELAYQLLAPPVQFPFEFALAHLRASLEERKALASAKTASAAVGRSGDSASGTSNLRPWNPVVTAITGLSPCPWNRTRTPRECPEGSAPEGDRPTVFGAVSRLGWPPERRGYALAWLLSPRNEHWRDASAGKKAHE